MSFQDSEYRQKVLGLRSVLVLSMIGSGWSAISYLLTGLMQPSMQKMVEEGTVKIPDEFASAFDMMMNSPRSYFLLAGALYALSLAGVIMMWKLRKNGFHYYTLAQLLVLVVTGLFLGKMYLSLGDIMLTALFVGYYFVAFKRLEALSADIEPTQKQDEEPHSDDSQDNAE